MRPRTELAIGFGLLVVAMIVGTGIGVSRRAPGAGDPRASTFLTGPDGARGVAEALTGLGVKVGQVRGRSLEPSIDSGDTRRAFAIVEPSVPLDASDMTRALALNDDGLSDLVLVGAATSRLMQCFGFRVSRRAIDSGMVVPPGVMPDTRASPWVHDVLAIGSARAQRDTSGILRREQFACEVPPIVSVDTLLVAVEGAVALRLHRSDVSTAVVLVSDANLFRNRVVRATDAGRYVLSLFAGYDRVDFDELHHGFGASGSLGGALLDWSVTQPVGWLVWQLAAVGVLALLAGAIRFGPTRAVIVTTRRSSLEHVRALATALAAARGHDVAVAAIVRGLRRRLQPAGRTPASGWREWLQHLAAHATQPRAREAAARLNAHTTPGQSADGVKNAAHAVEDLWKELRP
jgi:hypothetical protein